MYYGHVPFLYYYHFVVFFLFFFLKLIKGKFFHIQLFPETLADWLETKKIPHRYICIQHPRRLVGIHAFRCWYY